MGKVGKRADIERGAREGVAPKDQLTDTEQVLLWLVGVIGLVTRDTLLRLLGLSAGKCSTVDRALRRLSGRASGRGPARWGIWQKVRPGLECPDCRMATVVAIKVGRSVAVGTKFDFGHGGEGTPLDEFVVCSKTVGPDPRKRIERFLVHPPPPAFIEPRPGGPFDGAKYLRLTEAGRGRLAALRQAEGKRPLSIPSWEDVAWWPTYANLAYAAFAQDLLKELEFARLAWLLPVAVRSPGPKFDWTASDDDHGVTGKDARQPRHLGVHTELTLSNSRRMWLEPVQAVMDDQAWTKGDYRLIKARMALWTLFHRQPAPGRPSVYRQNYPDGLPSRLVFLVPESRVEKVLEYVRTSLSTDGKLDDFVVMVHSPRSLTDYVLAKVGRKRASSAKL